MPMQNIRKRTESLELSTLHPRAAKSSLSSGRQRPEKEDDSRTCFQRDRDRIIHCKAFRRLMHKTQVFLAPKGDHYRTRLTHVLEVSQIARTVARALRLNEDLVEAIALGHDLGHTPFGHAGEDVLREVHPGGFRHYEQSLRVVDVLEKDGRGLNLTMEVRDGIVKHSKGKAEIVPIKKEDRSATLEGQVVRFADVIAYLNHDLDDSIRAKVLKKSDIPASVIKAFGETHSKRIGAMVNDLIKTSLSTDLQEIRMSDGIHGPMEELREFLHARVYEGEDTKREFKKARKIVTELYNYFLEHPAELLRDVPAVEGEDMRQRACDIVAGMTDRFAVDTYSRLFLPMAWNVY